MSVDKTEMRKIAIIGSGFSSLSAACYLSKAGYQVDVYEKNAGLGGRARMLEIDGFRFDMGPSWYWMPDVFERFFADFGKSPSDYYTLMKLSPAYRVYFEDGSFMEIPDSLDEICRIFESEEKGGAEKLKDFMSAASYNYDVAVKDLVYQPGLSPLELLKPQTIKKLDQFFTSIRHEVRKRFKSKKLIRILEFPVLFLGAKPQDTPAFYSFMNFADFGLGTWYPMGGMFEVVKAMVALADSLGVAFHRSSAVDEIVLEKGRVVGVSINGSIEKADVVLSGADYVHTESLLPQAFRAYSASYWEKRVFAPSALLFYLAFDKKIDNIRHHTLFFDRDFESHLEDIYDKAAWPEDPLFYASFPSVSDNSVAPEGKEIAFLLVPLAVGLNEDGIDRDKYLHDLLTRLESLTGQSLRDHLLFSKSYCIRDFEKDYHAYKGNAYGLANTLRQTAFLRPRLKSKKVEGLYFTGQLTVPGPGVPPALISGKLAASLITQHLEKIAAYESIV